MINGEKIFKDDKIKSINPADTSQVIANASKATKEDVEDAFKAANEAYKSWKTWSANDRAELMLRVSAIIRRRKAEIAAIMVYEAGNHGMKRLEMQLKVLILLNTMHVQ